MDEKEKRKIEALKKVAAESSAVDSLEGFIFHVSQSVSSQESLRYFFRGHSEAGWVARPRVFRNYGWSQREHILLRELISVQAEEFHQDETFFDKLVRAQHYGLPTRLLDLSLSPLIALYFAVADSKHDNDDGDGFSP